MVPINAYIKRNGTFFQVKGQIEKFYLHLNFPPGVVVVESKYCINFALPPLNYIVYIKIRQVYLNLLIDLNV